MEISYSDKAQVLAQSLPYIQKYYNKIVVVKYGGDAMKSEELKQAVMSDIVRSFSCRHQSGAGSWGRPGNQRNARENREGVQVCRRTPLYRCRNRGDCANGARGKSE